MRQLYTDVCLEDLEEMMLQKIRTHLLGLNKYKNNDKQKILELCQIGKLLGSYFNEFDIVKVRESPDFIISNGHVEIGLEHELVLDKDSVEKEGFYKNICSKVENNLEKDDSIPNFLVTIYFKNNISHELKYKNELIKVLTDIVREFVLNGILIENDIVDKVIKMKHTIKSVNVNFGAYMQKSISKDVIFKYLQKKEDKLNNYKQNSVLKQWLVLIIGNLGESSYELRQQFDIELKTKFDKVFLYEDFKNKLFELK